MDGPRLRRKRHRYCRYSRVYRYGRRNCWATLGLALTNKKNLSQHLHRDRNRNCGICGIGISCGCRCNGGGRGSWCNGGCQWAISILYPSDVIVSTDQLSSTCYVDRSNFLIWMRWPSSDHSLGLGVSWMTCRARCGMCGCHCKNCEWFPGHSNGYCWSDDIGTSGWSYADRAGSCCWWWGHSNLGRCLSHISRVFRW